MEKPAADGWIEYQDGERQANAEIADGEAQIADAKVQLADAKKEIEQIEKPTWYIYDRSHLPEYSGYGDNADRMESQSGKFSIDFLSGCSTDQSDHDDAYGRRRENAHRNVESVRIQQEVYRSEVSWICSACDSDRWYFGVMIGEKILPYIIITAYKIMYGICRM